MRSRLTRAAAYLLLAVAAAFGPASIPARQDGPKPESKACACKLCEALGKKKIDPAGTTLELSIKLNEKGRVTDDAVVEAVRKFLTDALEKDAGLKTDDQKRTTKDDEKKTAAYAKDKKNWPTDADKYDCRFDLVTFDGENRVSFYEVEHERVFTGKGPNPDTQAQWIKYARVAEATGIPLHIVVPEEQKAEAKVFLEACFKNGHLTDRLVLQRLWGFKKK